LGGFRESKAVQFRVDLNRLHATIIPSPSRVPSGPGGSDGSRLRKPLSCPLSRTASFASWCAAERSPYCI
jgi:hypothetical protein